MSRKCTCRHCVAPTVQAVVEPVHEPVQLPDRPRPFRVHHDGRTQDCVLHPDGTLTAAIGGEVRRNFMTFDEMRERNWSTAHIEWDPAPRADEPAQAAEAETPEPVQGHLEGLAA
ncbi:hypothetical protein ACTWJ9_33225 (plasmid) [Streptomyces sp. GDS52]|uniref:hypothetical protein n=1 Tax=Streptomyces sp. GDS52 TaxID=3406419 RepID=UPI003FD42AA9